MILLLLIVSLPGLAALSFNIQIEEYKYTQQIKRHYQTVLTEALGEPVVYRPGNTSPDILISVDTPRDEDLTRALYFIDQILPSVQVSQSSSELPEDGLRAVVQQPLQYKVNGTVFEVDSMESALNLLKRGRVSAIIDNATSQGAYLLVDDTLEITPLTEEKQVSVWFKDAALAEVYDKNVLGVTSYWVEQSEASASEETINVYLLYKFFNPETKSFQTLKKEERVVKWLFEEQLGLQIAIQNSNTKSVFEAMLQTDNTCVFNVRKTPERASIAAFSEPTIQYLGLALYTKKGSAFNSVLETHMLDEIGFEQVTKLFPDVMLGYTEVISNFMPEEMKASSNTINLTPVNQVSQVNFDYRHTLSMLEKGRVDALVEYPIIFPELVQLYDLKTEFSGIQLVEKGAVSVGHIACSDSLVGKGLVTKINRLLNDPVLREELALLQMAGYSDKQKKEGVRLLNQFYQP